MRTVNNWIIAEKVKPETKEVPKKTLIRKESNDGKWTDEIFIEHPFKMKVIFAPDTYTNNGIEYPTNLKKGDYFYLSGEKYQEVNTSNNRLFTWQEQQYSLVRFTEIVAIL